MTPLQAHEKDYRPGRQEAQVWLAADLIGYVYRNPYEIYCTSKGCEKRATHILADLSGAGTDRISARLWWKVSAWCVDHRDNAFRRRPCQHVDYLDQAQLMGAEFARNREAHQQWLFKREELRREESFKDYGHILLFGGSAGTVHELADGTYQFRARDGSKKAICCLAQGHWLSDFRHRGRRGGGPNEHSTTCPNRQPESPQ